MGYNVIAPVGDNLKALFIGMKEFPTENVFLITPEDKLKDAENLQKKLEEFTISSNIVKIKGNTMEEMFRSFGKICAAHDEDNLIVNVATGDRMSTCAALSAAYANGLKAFGIEGNKCMLLPIMKLSYYKELSDSKLKILNELDPEEHISLKELSNKVKMSVSLVSYHINGNYKHKGLKEFRLVDIKDDNKNLCIKLSEMGGLLLKGYIKQGQEE